AGARRISFSGPSPRPARGDKKTPAGWPRRGRQLKLVTRASRNDVAVDADAQAVVVLIRDGVEGSRLGRAGQRPVGHNGVLRCRLQLLVDHIEAHIEPRCEVVLGPGADRPEGPVVAARPTVDLRRSEGDRAANSARNGKGARANVRSALRLADRPI